MTPFFTSAPAAFINWSRFLMSHKSPKDTILLFPTPQRLEDSSNFHLRVPVYAFRWYTSLLDYGNCSVVVYGVAIAPMIPIHTKVHIVQLICRNSPLLAVPPFAIKIAFLPCPISVWLVWAVYRWHDDRCRLLPTLILKLVHLIDGDVINRKGCLKCYLPRLLFRVVPNTSQLLHCGGMVPSMAIGCR
jgi:hypothetical protein